MPLKTPHTFAFATTTEVVRVADYLGRIAAGLRDGQVDLVVSGQTLHLETGDVVRLRLQARQDPGDGMASLGVEITWRPVEACSGAGHLSGTGSAA